MSTLVLDNRADILAPLVGTPWEASAKGPDTFDCWALAVFLQSKIYGRKLPWADDLPSADASVREIIEAIRASALHRTWLQVETPADGDLVLMSAGIFPNHIGVWVNGGPGLTGIWHCTRDGGVMCQTLAQVRADWSRVVFHRYVEQTVERTLQTLPLDQGTGARAVIIRDLMSPDAGTEIERAEVGRSVAELIAGLERVDGYWVCLNGVPLLRRNPENGEDEWLQAVDEGDTVWVLPMPPEGGDREGGGSQVLAAVLTIVVSLAAPHAAAWMLGRDVAALGFGGKLLSAGIAVGANALISRFVPRPETVAPLADPDPTYSFGQVSNRMRPGATVPRIYGTMKRVPDLLAPPWAEYEDNEQLVHILLCIGQGEYQITEFGISDTPVWTSAGGLTGAVPNCEYQIAQPGELVTLFPSAVDLNSEVEALELPASQVVGPFVAVPTGAVASELVLDFAFPRGLFSAPGGAIATASVTWRLEAQLIDDAGVALGAWTVLQDTSYSAATTTPQRLTKRYAVATGRYQVRVTRTSVSSITGAGAQDGLFWLSLKAKRPVSDPFSNVTTLALRMRADTASATALQEWYVKATAILPHFDTNGQLVVGPTEAIEAAALDACRATYGLELEDGQIDLPQLEAIAATWRSRGDVCCTAIERDLGAWEVLEMVLAAGRTRPEFIGAMVTFVRDELRPASRLITQADMVRGSFEIERAHFKRESPNVVIKRYRDRDGAMRTVECAPDGVIDKRSATIIDQVIVDEDQNWREGMFAAASNNLRRRWPSWIMLAGGKSLVRGQVVEVSHPRPGYGSPSRVEAESWPQLSLSRDHGLAASEMGWLLLTQPDGSPWGPVAVRGLEGDPDTVVVDEADFDTVLASATEVDVYSKDPRDWLITHADPAGSANTIALDGRQADATRAVIGKDGKRQLKCMIVEVAPSAEGQVEVLAVEDPEAVHSADEGAAPVSANPAPLTINNRPTWQNIVIVGTEGSGTTATHRITGPVAPDAVSYVAEVATSFATGNWTEAARSPSPDFDGPTTNGTDISIRVAAIGSVFTGPWTYFRTNLDETVDGVSIAVLDPLAS